MKNQIFSKEQLEKITAITKSWNEECHNLSAYRLLATDIKEFFDKITIVFVTLMYSEYLRLPGQWTGDTMTDVLVKSFPEKVEAPLAFFKSVRPALIVFLGYLKQIGVIKNHETLINKLSPAACKMCRIVEKNGDSPPPRQLALDGFEPVSSGEQFEKQPRQSAAKKENKAALIPDDSITDDERVSVAPFVEPTFDQWRALYDAAKGIKEFAPWQYLNNLDIVALQFPEREEPVFCSVWGKEGQEYAVSIYPGYDSFGRFERLVMQEHIGNIPPLIYYEQDCLMCNFTNRENVSPQDRETLRELGLRFRGRNEWIVFRTMEPGLFPWHLDAEQAALMTECLHKLLEACQNYIDENIRVDFRKGEMILHYYVPGDKRWRTKAEGVGIYEISAPYIEIGNEFTMQQLKRKPRNGARLEFELMYFPEPMQEARKERPYYPRFLLLVDQGSGMAIDQDLVDLKCDFMQEAFDILGNYIERFGKPISIQVRDNDVANYIDDFCGQAEIELISGQGMPATDVLLDELFGFAGLN